MVLHHKKSNFKKRIISDWWEDKQLKNENNLKKWFVKKYFIFMMCFRSEKIQIQIQIILLDGNQ